MAFMPTHGTRAGEAPHVFDHLLELLGGIDAGVIFFSIKLIDDEAEAIIWNGESDLMARSTAVIGGHPDV